MSATGLLKDASGTITTGATAQTALAAAAGRKYLTVHNPTNETEALLVNITGATATANNAVHLAPGGAVTFETWMIPENAVSVLAATTGHRYIIWWA